MVPVNASVSQALVFLLLAPAAGATTPIPCQSDACEAERVVDEGSFLQVSGAHSLPEGQTASCERRVAAYVKGLGDRNVSLIVEQMTPDALVYSDSAGLKTPPAAFYGSFLPSLFSAQSEVLELWCEKKGPKNNTAAARFNFTWFDTQGGDIQGGIYTDVFMFVDGSDPEPLIQELQMFENPALLFPALGR
jgi:hypothetical protein